MKHGTGIWMDQTKAIIVRVNGDDTSVEHLTTTVEPKHKSTSGVRSKRPYWHRTVNSAKRNELHREGDIRRFFERVETAIGNEVPLIVCGPGEGKEAFCRYLEEHRRARPATATTTSRLTEAQIIARLKAACGVHPERKILRAT